ALQLLGGAVKKKRRIEITTLTEWTWVIRKPGVLLPIWCAECAAAGCMVTPEEAAVIARVNTRTIYRWVEAGMAHFTETPEGRLFVCVASLPAVSAMPEVNEPGLA